MPAEKDAAKPAEGKGPRLVVVGDSDFLTDAQIAYAASDVLHLHQIKTQLDAMLAREGRTEIARACFAFLPVRASLDLAGWAEEDIFAH